MRRSIEMAAALALSASKEEIDESWGDAVATDPASSKDSSRRMNDDRSVQRALDRIKDRGFSD